MKRAVLMLAVLSTALLQGVNGQKVRVKRAVVATLEKSFDVRIEHTNADDPFLLLGNTRGVYLEGYGAVFTTELNLVNSPTLTPFRQTISKEEVARVRNKKLQRLAALKQAMREMLISSATALDTVPMNERIVIGITLFYFSWEDTTGLPSQIVMQAERQRLLGRAIADTAIRTEEF